MKRENRIYRKRKGFHRQLALLMTAVLIMSESNLTVLATEANAGEKLCVCESKCSADAVNVDCLVCAENYVNCICQESAAPEEGGDETLDDGNKAGVLGTDSDEDIGGGENTGDNGKEDSNVGMEDSAGDNAIEEPGLQEGTELLKEQKQIENNVQATEAQASADVENEGIEAYAVGDAFEDSSGIRYRIIGENQIEVYSGINGTSLNGNVVIPETLENNGVIYRVTAIGKNAFFACSSLSSIEIPNSVTSIGESAFYDCSSLNSIKFSSNLTTIERVAFYGCSSLNNAEIPDSVTSIGEYAFQDCISLNNVRIPSGITSIERQVFSNCSSLRSVEIPNSVTNIKEHAFHGCSSLSSVEIPNSVTSMQEGVFFACSSLSSIEIPSSVTQIANYVFYDCSNLSSIKISNSITSIGVNAFSNCSKLNALQIVVPINGVAITAPQVAQDAFLNLPYDRSIIFMTEDGKPLAGSTFTVAKSAYLGAEDGNTSDLLWYEWKVEEPRTTDITIKVKKDNVDWADHTRQFGLKPTDNPDAAMITDFTTAVDGEYRIYDTTNASSVTDTGVNVTVTGGVGEAAIDYYTVKFYDGNAAYADSTPQTPQIVLKGQTASEPAAPASSITNRKFAGWMTADGGSSLFDFSAPVTGKTDIYAGWTENPSVYKITYHLDDYTASAADCQYTYGIGHKLPAPEKSGFIFDGWYENADYSGSKVTSIGSTETGDKEYYGRWISEAVAEHIIASSADEGGSISPVGNVRVPDGGEQTFEITPADGYRIKTVMVGNQDKTDELTGGAAAKAVQAQSEASRYYTFYDVREDHTIRVTFETESGGNTGGNGGESGGGTGGDSGNSGESDGNAGSSGGNSSESGGNTGGSGGNSGESGGNTGGSGGNNGNSGSNESTGNNNTTGTNGNSAINANNPNTAESSISRSSNSNKNNNSSNQSAASKDAEPKTGDTSSVEIYATVAMIAGLAYLMLYFADKERGMTEDEKQEIIMSLIRWAKCGSRIRRYVVLVPIFVLLFYYHSIGKRVYVEWEESLA